jgi:hypothetical protein
MVLLSSDSLKRLRLLTTTACKQRRWHSPGSRGQLTIPQMFYQW